MENDVYGGNQMEKEEARGPLETRVHPPVRLKAKAKHFRIHVRIFTHLN